MSKIIQSHGSLGQGISAFSKFGKLLDKEAITKVAAPYTKDVLPGLISNNIASNAVSNWINKLERRTSRKGAVRTEKRFTLFTSSEDMDNIIKIVDALEKSGLLIDGASKTMEHEIKKTKRWVFPAMVKPMAASLVEPMVSSLIQHVASSLLDAITGKGVCRARKGNEDGFMPLPLPFMMKILQKGVTRSVKG